MLSRATAPIPMTVRVAMWLLVATYIAGLVLTIFDRRPLPRFSGDQDQLIRGAALGAAALIAIPFAALFLFILQSMTRGKNWPRFVLVGLTALEAFYALQLPGNQAGPPPAPYLNAILWLVQCAAVAFLFLPSSNRWYRAMSSTPR